MPIGMSVFVFSFVITLATLNIGWWMVLGKEQRLQFYDCLDKMVEKFQHKAV